MMNRTYRTYLLSTLAALVAAISFTADGLAQASRTFFISDVDASQFPTVSFRLRAVDIDNRVVEGLNSESLTVYENGQQVGEVQVTPHQDGPITYIFVIDAGSNYLSMNRQIPVVQVLNTLATDEYFRDGVDTAVILARQISGGLEQTNVIQPPTQSRSEFSTGVALIRGLDRSLTATEGLQGVQDAIRMIPDILEEHGDQTTAIIFMTYYIEEPAINVAPTTAEKVAEQAELIHTPVYVFHTHPGATRADTLTILADGSSGEYEHLRSATFRAAIASVYQSIASQREYYEVSYSSPLADPESRQITVNSPTPPEEGTTGTYQIQVLPPDVAITEPAPNSTLRREEFLGEEEDAVPAFDVNETNVIAEASFPDEHPRSIETAELLVNGTLVDQVEAAPDQTRFEFVWDLSAFDTEGTQPVTLSVRVTDELGLEGQGDISLALEVTLLEEQTGLDMSRVAAIGVPALCLIGLALAAAVGGAAYLIRKGSGPSAESGEPGKAPMATMFSAEAHDLVLATLTVIEGPSGMVGEILRITGLSTALGRDPAQTDISFYADQQSSVSRVHCEIVLEDDNAFRLIDRNSSAGTWLNGRKIHPEVPVVIEDQDEIVMGDLAQRGVKLEFNFATPDEHRPYSGTADDRTHLLPDQDPADWSPSDD